MKRTALRPQRLTPRRRAPDRIPHTRIRPKASAAATAEEKRHMARIAALGCCVCGAAAEVHHVTSDGMKRITRSHRRVTPLCATGHHRLGPDAVHVIGHAGFTRKFEIGLLELADRLWAESDGFAGE